MGLRPVAPGQFPLPVVEAAADESLRGRILEGLSVGDTHQGGIPENLPAVFPFWRPVVIRKLCVPRVRLG